MKRWPWSLLLLITSCQDYPFVVQTNQRVATRRYEIEVETEGKTDVLFVIDNSASMLEEQELLKENINGFIGVLTRSVNDYQVGIVSTDIFRGPDPSCQPCCDQDTDADGIPDWSTCDQGRLVAADGRRRLFRRPNGETVEQTAALTEQLILNFNETVTALGTGGHPTEAGFEAIRRALDPLGDVATRALNFGFLREDADLTLIFLSDEDDCSAPAEWYGAEGRDDADCYLGNGLTPVSEYLDFLVELKGNINRVRAAAILGANSNSDVELGYSAAGCFTTDEGLASNACGCWSSRFLPDRRPDAIGEFYCNLLSEPPFDQPGERIPFQSINQGGCVALPGSRYIEFIDELRTRRVANGLQPGVDVDSICRDNYAETLERIALSVVLSNCFRLRESPATLDGVRFLRNRQPLDRVPSGSTQPGWSFSEATKEVCLEGGVIKEVGDIFEIVIPTETPRGIEDEE